MSPARLLRWGPAITAAAGVAWVVAGLASRLSPDRDDWDCNSAADYATNTLGTAAFLMMAPAVLVLYLWQRERLGTLGRSGFALAFAGSLAAGVNNPIEHCAGVEILGLIVWMPATLLLVVGLLSLGLATILARALPAWTGAAPIIGMIGMAAGAPWPGSLVLGCAWLLVGYALRSSRGHPAAHPA